MRQGKRVLALVAAAGVTLGVTGGCFRNENVTVDVSVPQLKSMECGKIIIDRLKTFEGLKYATPNVGQRTITVTYDSTRMAIKNVEMAIAETGFEANGVPPNEAARAKLPEACR